MILRLSLISLAGVCFGLGVFTFTYGEGLSYFSADPKACVNCHIMQPQFDSWQKASHHTVAKCVDCHLPKDFVGKWLAKAENGYFHSKGFTFQDFQEPIMIKAKNSKILKENCIRCHEGLVHGLLDSTDHYKDTNCLDCHRTVGHGERTGLGGREIMQHLGDKK